MAKKGRSTQSIVNTFGGWTDVRNDEQSLGFQLINPIGQLLDDIRKQTERIGKNYFLPSSIVSDIDTYYQIKLSNNFQFSKEDNDNTNFIFTPPTVSGVLNGTSYAVQIAEKNDIESFWYTSLPDRISLSTTVSGLHNLASGTINQSPFSYSSLSLPTPNHVSVTVSGGASFVGIMGNGFIRKSIVQIEGKNREGKEITEELIFIHNETLKTFNEFKEIYPSGLRVYGIEDSTIATISFDAAQFNHEDYPTSYNLDVTKYKDDMPLFWKIGSGEAGTKTLDISKYQIDELELRMEGFTEKDVILQQELFDMNGIRITPRDLSVEPDSDRLWIVDDETLYAYTSELPYPNLKSLQGKNYQADSVIEPSSYYSIPGNEISIDYIWRRPVRGMITHRAWVEHPDGAKFSLENGVEVSYHTDSSSWIFGEPELRQIRPTEFYTLTKAGNYTFCLEVVYDNEVRSIDKRVISLLTIQPLAQFDLVSLGISSAVGIDFDSEYNLWILDATGSKHKIERHYDNMIIDFKRKIIYFREPYDQVRVL